MTWTLVAAGTYAADEGSVDEVVVTIDGAAQAGDLLVLVGGKGNSDGTPFTAAGWTSQAQAQGGTSRCCILTKVHDGSESDPLLVTLGDLGNIAGVIQVWRTDGAIDDIAALAAGTGSSVTTVTAPSDIGILPGDVLIGAVDTGEASALTRPADAVDAPGVTWAGDSVESPAVNYFTVAAGGAHALDVVHRFAAAGASSGACELNSTTTLAEAAAVWLRIRDREVIAQEPDPPGAEVGIPDTFEVTQGPPNILSFAIGGAEVGIPPGFRVSATGPAQVLLAVPRHDRPQMTESGTEGQVLTYHSNRKPSWEDGGADTTSLVIDTASGTYDIDAAVALTHEITLTGATELTPVGTSAADEAIDLRLVLFPEEEDVTWGGTILWEGGSAPDLSGLGAGESVVIGFLSTDEGDTWRGFLATSGGPDDQTAAEVPFTPAGTIASTNTQAAVEEVATDAASALSTHAGTPHGGDPSEDTQVWMPLTSVDGGEPVLVWDGDDSLIPTLVSV